eukprot:gene16429-19503_t
MDVCSGEADTFFLTGMDDEEALLADPSGKTPLPRAFL